MCVWCVFGCLTSPRLFEHVFHFVVDVCELGVSLVHFFVELLYHRCLHVQFLLLIHSDACRQAGEKEGERDNVSLGTFACAFVSKVTVVYVNVWCVRLLVYEALSYEWFHAHSIHVNPWIAVNIEIKFNYAHRYANR